MRKRKPRNLCCEFSYCCRICSKNSRKDIGRFLDLEQKNHVHKPNGEWNDVADTMMTNFSESGHLVFRVSSAFERTELKNKGQGNLSIHFNGSDETVEVILRTVISVNQLSVYGAVAEMCEELAWEISKCSNGTGKPVAL